MADVTKEESHNDPADVRRRDLIRRLDAGAWGLFFVWAGIALYAGFSWGTGLVCFGILILAGQIARKYFALRIERFWILAGVLFILGGVWELFSIQVGLVPILCIVVGVALLASAFIGSPGD
jgi:hypothetical protein